MTDDDARVLESALREWNRFHSPRSFVEQVLPIIRDAAGIDSLLSHFAEEARARVVRELQERYGPHVDLDDESAWGLAAGTYLDPEERLRRHREWVAHAVRVAIPAIRAWLAAHPGGGRERS